MTAVSLQIPIIYQYLTNWYLTLRRLLCYNEFKHLGEKLYENAPQATQSFR